MVPYFGVRHNMLNSMLYCTFLAFKYPTRISDKQNLKNSQVQLEISQVQN